MQWMEVFSRKYSVEILEATELPKSAAQLSDELDIPIATCYRRINELSDVGFLEEYPEREDDGFGTARFRRSIDSLDVCFDDSVTVSAVARGDRRTGLEKLVARILSAIGVSERSSHDRPSRMSETGDADVSALNNTNKYHE